ncbi:hypothetical protein LTS17_007870 [Exophiala oligosperma]
MTYPSRGHLTYDALQKHYEYHLNSTRADSANAHDSDVDPNGSTVASTAELQRPSDAEYKQAYRGGSSKYFTPERRQNRLEANLKFYQLKLSNIKADGAKTCAGFWLKGHHFECADQWWPTCDYCVHVMSLISRPLARLPDPFNFGPKTFTTGRKRLGIGRNVIDHQSFFQVVKGSIYPLKRFGTENQRTSRPRTFSSLILKPYVAREDAYLEDYLKLPFSTGTVK